MSGGKGAALRRGQRTDRSGARTSKTVWNAENGEGQLFREQANQVPVMLWMSDAGGCMTFFNRSWLKFTGRVLEEELGAGWLSGVHPDDARSCVETFNSALEARQAFKMEFRLRGADGEHHWMLCTGNPRRAGKKFNGYTGSAVDMTFRKRGEEARRASESRYRLLAESIGDVFFAMDAELKLTYWNKASEHLTGVRTTDAIGHALTELFPSIQGTEVERFFLDVLSTSRPGALIQEFPGRDGEAVFEIFAYPSQSGLSVIAKDITQRKKGESALRQSEFKYRTIFEHANDAILIFDPDTEVILETNRRACVAYGYAKEALVGMSLKAITKNVLRGEEQIRQTLTHGSYRDFETIHFHKDGKAINFLVNASVIEFAGKRAILSINHDITKRKQAEEYFSRALDWQEAIFETSQDAVFVGDEALRIDIVNRAASMLTGYAREELLGMHVSDLFDAAGRSVLCASHDRLLTGEEIRQESRLFRKDGSTVETEIVHRLVSISGTQYVHTIVHDVTARVRLEQALQESEERLRVLINAMTDMVCFKDASGRWLVANDAEVRVFDLHGIDYRGKTDLELAELCPVHRQEFLHGMKSDEEAWQNRKVTRSDEVMVEADGRRTVYDVIKVPLFHEHGIRKGLVVVGRDITERDHAERKLRLLAQTIASTRDGVAITDLKSVMLFVNDAFLKIYGYTEEELLGNPMVMLYAADPQGAKADEVLSATLGGGWYGEVGHRRKDGSSFPVELLTSVVRNDEGDPVALVGISRDITERKRAEEQIRTSLREKEVLLKEIHHRVKNNLQIVSSLLSLQSEHIADPDTLRLFKESQDRVKSMALIHEKLYQSSNLAAVNFAEYLRELAAHLFRSHGGAKRGVMFELVADDVSLGLDKAIPCGIIVNELISNCLKYAFPDGRKGKVRVGLRLDDSRLVTLTVSDNGVGVPAGLDFRNTDSLGLQLVSLLAVQLKGKISMAVGGNGSAASEGTEFTIVFST